MLCVLVSIELKTGDKRAVPPGSGNLAACFGIWHIKLYLYCCFWDQKNSIVTYATTAQAAVGVEAWLGLANIPNLSTGNVVQG